MSVATSSAEEKLAIMELSMSILVTSVRWILENCLDGPNVTHEDLKMKKDVAERASDIAYICSEVLTIDQENDKATKALGALKQLQCEDDTKIARLWAEGDGHIGSNLPLLLYLRKR